MRGMGWQNRPKVFTTRLNRKHEVSKQKWLATNLPGENAYAAKKTISTRFASKMAIFRLSSLGILPYPREVLSLEQNFLGIHK